jgi:hypothetical protein
MGGGDFHGVKKLAAVWRWSVQFLALGKKNGQNKKFSSASRQNKKNEGKEWAGPPTDTHFFYHPSPYSNSLEALVSRQNSFSYISNNCLLIYVVYWGRTHLL